MLLNSTFGNIYIKIKALPASVYCKNKVEFSEVHNTQMYVPLPVWAP